jgi:hypothetical protein
MVTTFSVEVDREEAWEAQPGGKVVDTQILSLSLNIFGGAGFVVLLLMAVKVLRQYRGSNTGSFRWHLRNLYLKQICALACLFFLAMAASYGVLQEPWAFLYLVIGFKTGTWWLHFVLDQRA